MQEVFSPKSGISCSQSVDLPLAEAPDMPITNAFMCIFLPFYSLYFPKICFCGNIRLPGNYYERHAAAKKYGPKALETLGWTGLDLDRARNAIDESGVALSAILTQSTDPEIQKKLDNIHVIEWEDLY